MPWQLFELQFLLPSFAIVLSRVSGLAIAAPLIGSPALPRRIKVAFAFAVSIMIFPVVLPRTAPTIELSQLLVTLLGELAIGLTIGLAVDLVFLGARLAGLVIGQQAGLAFGQVVNPMLGGQSTLVGQVYYLVTLMLFLAIGGHRVMVRALLDTFTTIPPGSFRFTESHTAMLEQLLTQTFVVGLRLAAPAVTALFIASLTMGLIARTVPQLNILTIGFQIRVFIGLAVAAISLSLAFDLLQDAILAALERVEAAFGVVA